MTSKTNTKDVRIPPAIISKSLRTETCTIGTIAPSCSFSLFTINVKHWLGCRTITIHSQCEVCPSTWNEVYLPTLLVLWRTTTVLSTECQLIDTSTWIVGRPHCTPVVLWPGNTWTTHINYLSTTREAIEFHPESE